MKRIIVFLVALPVLSFMSQAQEIVRVCGTEAVTLRAGNFQYGNIQWERSTDNERWEAIPGANDTTYTFTPEKDMYYRLVASFSECPPEVSETAFVQMPPRANAGFDRVSPGSEIRLTANSPAGAEGMWEVMAGNGGSLSDNSDPHAVFQGADSLYTLVWTLSNACGVDTDTLSIRFRQNEYIENLAIVDDTDQILSDSLQMEEGLYIIRFSDPAPVITDGTILAGITRGGFLRKVDSFTLDGDTYHIQTTQANLEDITINGAYNLGVAFELDTLLGPEKMQRGMTRLSEKPTRRELTTNPMFKQGIYYYIIDEEPLYVHPGVSLEKDEDEDEETTISLKFERTLLEDSGVTLTLNGEYAFTPNFVADLEYTGLNLDYFRMGLSNARVVRSVDLTLSASATALSLEKSFTLLSLKRDMIFVIGTVPLLITAGFSIEGEATASVGATMDITQGFTNTTYYDAYVEYINNKWGYVYEEDSHTEPVSSLQINGSIEQHFEIGPTLSLTIYRIAGPYIDLRLEQDFGLCTDFNYWQTNMNIGGSLTLGARAEILSWTLIDVSRKWTQGFYHYQFPHKLEIVSGNNQSYKPGSQLANPVKVRVKSNKGLVLPGARVKFEPQDGGSVGQSMVTADAGGYAETTWTPGGDERSSLKVISMDCDGENISLSPMILNAFSINYGVDCSKSTLAVSIEKTGNMIRPVAVMGHQPYTYSTDGQSYGSQLPSMDISTGYFYLFYVKDVQGCISSASFSEPSEACRHSDLSLDLQTAASTITAFAQGGNPPYSYALENQEGPYTTHNTFINVPVGQHVVFVKDDNGCYAAQTTAIYKPQRPNCGLLVDERDGNVYPTVMIGNQCWMAENLRYLPEVTGYAHLIWNSETEPRYAVYDYKDRENSVAVAMASEHYMNYGVLYNYPAASAGMAHDYGAPIGVQGACPAGWHLPAGAEWGELMNYIRAQFMPEEPLSFYSTGNVLKSCRQVNSPLGGPCTTDQHPRWDAHPTQYGTDDFGFSALPAGLRAPSGAFNYMGRSTSFWISHATGEFTHAYINYQSEGLGRSAYHSTSKASGFSVRCVKD